MSASVALSSIACGLLGFVFTVHSHPHPFPSPFERLVRAAPMSHRHLEARLTGGFAWAELRRDESSSRFEADELPIVGRAGEILAEARQSNTTDLHHAAGSASLLTRDDASAITRFERVVHESPQHAAAWSDLAAARYELAMHRQEPAVLPAALVAADRALALAPHLCEARFNRALILTRLGLLTAARQAWRDAAAAETSLPWMREANLRLFELNAGSNSFADDLKRSLVSAEAGDLASLRSLARTNIQELRLAGEALALNAWPEELERGDEPAAQRALRRAQFIAAEVGASNGNWLLADVLQFIEQAHASEARWRNVVVAHRTYRQGRITYHRQLPDSDVQLRRATALFTRIKSPMTNVARYYSANAMFDRNRPEEAADALLHVLREVDARRHPSLAAGAEKQLGVYYAFRGMWATALLHLHRSWRIFSSSGEQTNAAFVQAIIGEVHDRIGQFGSGWRHRRAALDVLGRSAPDDRLVSVLAGAVHAEIMRGELESALSLLSVASAHAKQTRNPVLIAEMLLREARVLLAIRSGASAANALRDAEAAVDQIRDPLTRSRIQADVWMAESEIVRRTDPLVAIEIVTRAIAFYEAKRFHMLLPAAYLERGRAFLAARDENRALDDLLKGFAELERQRTNVAPDIRMTVFDTVPELLAEIVQLLLERGRTEQAFSVVEHARARTLIESLGLQFDASYHVSSTEISSALPPRTVIVEYALLPHAVAVFCLRREGLSIVRLPAEPQRLRHQVAALAQALDERKPADVVDGLAAELHGALIEPIRAHLAGAQALIIVPDRFLNAVPFPALLDRRYGRYLVEDYRISIAPSSAFSLRRARSRSFEPILIVNDPLLRGGDASLPGSRREAAGIAALYGRATTLTGPDATVDRFLATAARSAVIHYAGHAQSTEGGGFLSLAASPAQDGRIDAGTVCRLRLPKTRLVVLAACATMKGSIHRVEGMPSISRAFLAAGVPTVVGTLWEVDDRSAASLFLQFHQFLSKGRSPAAALQAAQCALLRGGSERLRHPSVWAAAEVLGVD